jgi:hypothetical protein
VLTNDPISKLADQLRSDGEVRRLLERRDHASKRVWPRERRQEEVDVQGGGSAASTPAPHQGETDNRTFIEPGEALT